MSMKAALLCALVTAFTAPFASPSGDPLTVLVCVFVAAGVSFGATLALARIRRFEELLRMKRWLAVGVVCLVVNVSLWLAFQILVGLNNRHAAL